MNRLAARLRDEQGWAILTSILVLGILVSLSLPLLSLVDTQQRQTAHERKSESSFNLAEAAFDATVFVLAKDWPSVSTGAYPSTCTAASTSTKCPSAALLASSYAGTDYTSPGWTVRVRDDVAGSDYYDPAAVEASAATWDANGNAKVWVRADAHAEGRDRTVVALVRRQDKLESFPRNIITSGWFATGNTGRKVIVDTKGLAAQPAPLSVRCTQPAPSSCLNFQPERGQVSPDTSTPGYLGQTAVSTDALERFRARAKALGTYHASGCPGSPAGELVFVENGSCSFKGGKDSNTPDSPGMFILARGTIAFSGSMSYYGLLYAANLQRTTGSVVTVGGAATIFGSVTVDGPGGVTVGSNGENIIYDDRVFGFVKSFGGAAPVQGTWRELPAS